MDARNGTEDKGERLVTALGEAAQMYLSSDDDGRGAAIVQLAAILDFFGHTGAGGLMTPLVILLGALRDLQGGAKLAKILKPQTVKHRPRDDLALRTIKVVAAVVMDQLCEHARLSRPEAAKAVARTFSEFGLSNFRGRRVSATTIANWRDQIKEAAETSELAREYKRVCAIDAEVLAQNAPLESKRKFLLARRLPLLLIQFGEARGTKAAKTRQRLCSDIQRRIPKKAAS